MFGKLGDIAGMMKQAREMQSRMKEVHEQIAGARYDADSGAGAVNATVNGKMELVNIRISAETVAGGDVEMLEDLVKSAVCAAQQKASEGAKAEVQKITGGMNLPGMESLLGG
jgi:DNA-binding YbaB/EbfC family protein